MSDFDLLKPGILLEDQEKYQQLCEQLDNITQAMQENINPSQKFFQKKDFMGSHPVSMTLRNLNEVWTHPDDYLICEKTDGVRYLLVIMTTGEVYLTGRQTGAGGVRKLQFFQINVNLPKKMFQGKHFEIMYVFDGEMCVDKYIDFIDNNITKTQAKYFIFDTMIANEAETFGDDYIVRLKHAEYFKKFKKFCKSMDKQMKEPGLQTFQEFKSIVADLPVIKFVVKDFFYFCNTEYLLNYYNKNLPHLNDGLIFTQIQPPYKPGTCNSIIKWKPPHMNTIDFLVCPNENLLPLNIADLYVNSGDNFIFFGYMYISEEMQTKLQIMIQNLQQQQDEMEIEGEIEEAQEIKGVICECNYALLSEKEAQQIHEAYETNDFNDMIEKSVLFGLDDTVMERKQEIQQMQTSVEKNKEFLEKYQQKGWKFLKTREDKSRANNKYIADNIMETIEENITAQTLIDKSKDEVAQKQAIQETIRREEQNRRREEQNKQNGQNPTKKVCINK